MPLNGHTQSQPKTLGPHPSRFQLYKHKPYVLQLCVTTHPLTKGFVFCMALGHSIKEHRPATPVKCASQRFSNVVSFPFTLTNSLALADVYSDVFMHTSANEIAVV